MDWSGCPSGQTSCGRAADPGAATASWSRPAAQCSSSSGGHFGPTQWQNIPMALEHGRGPLFDLK